MGNEQSASGDCQNESQSRGCREQARACVVNGDEATRAAAADSWSSFTSSSRGHNGAVSGAAVDVAISGAVIRSHSASSRTSVSSTGWLSSVNRCTHASPFSTRSLRIRRTHYKPTLRASTMDNVGGGQAAAASQQKPSATAAATANLFANTPPSSRNSRPAQVLRQRSAVSFSNAASTGSQSNMTTTESTQEKGPPLASLLGLSAYQQQQLVQSWPRIQQSGGHTVGAEIFRKLTSKCPPIKETFQKADVVERLAPRTRGYDIYKEHGRLLFDVFQTAINALGDSAEEVTEMCRGYGAKHLSLRGDGFQIRMWDDLSELLVEHITRLDAVRRHRELMRAWTALIMFLVEKMKDGYEQGLRKCSSPAVVNASFVYRKFSTPDDDLEALNLRDVDDAECVGSSSSVRRKARTDQNLHQEIDRERRLSILNEKSLEDK